MPAGAAPGEDSGFRLTAGGSSGGATGATGAVTVLPSAEGSGGCVVLETAGGAAEVPETGAGGAGGGLSVSSTMGAEEGTDSKTSSAGGGGAGGGGSSVDSHADRRAAPSATARMSAKRLARESGCVVFECGLLIGCSPPGIAAGSGRKLLPANRIIRISSPRAIPAGTSREPCPGAGATSA